MAKFTKLRQLCFDIPVAGPVVGEFVVSRVDRSRLFLLSGAVGGQPHSADIWLAMLAVFAVVVVAVMVVVVDMVPDGGRGAGWRVYLCENDDDVADLRVKGDQNASQAEGERRLEKGEEVKE